MAKQTEVKPKNRFSNLTDDEKVSLKEAVSEAVDIARGRAMAHAKFINSPGQLPARKIYFAERRKQQAARKKEREERQQAAKEKYEKALNEKQRKLEIERVKL